MRGYPENTFDGDKQLIRSIIDVNQLVILSNLYFRYSGGTVLIASFGIFAYQNLDLKKNRMSDGLAANNSTSTKLLIETLVDMKE